jgi:uncharacterized small protein (DUF1192 family)
LVARFIDRRVSRVNFADMDLEDILPRKPGDPLAGLVTQDLDRLSVEELRDRIATLEGEIVRTRAKMESAVHHRASAESLFKR